MNKTTSFPSDVSFEIDLNNSNQERSNLCTPKLSIMNSDFQLNSPLSPIYQKQNDFLTPKKQNRSSEKLSPLCLSDFICTTPIPKKKSKTQSNNSEFRRITPTSINKEKTSDCRKILNCFNDFNITEMKISGFNDNSKQRNTLNCFSMKQLVGDLTESRDFLEEQQNSKCSYNESVTFLSTKFPVSVQTNEDSLVNETALNNIAKVYTTILNNSLVLNITSEVYFLISLLTKRDFTCNIEFKCGDQTKFSCSYYFRTVHNIVYFIVRVIESQLHILRYLDKATLMLLADNSALNFFSNKTCAQLKNIVDSKSDRVIEILEDSLQTNVYFNVDTDNRENFPTDVAFHIFRKQRDSFYEILRIWEINHLRSGWSFSIGLGGRIKNLLCLVSDPTNFIHFCRLFKDQLLSTCGKYQNVCIHILYYYNNLLMNFLVSGGVYI